MTITSRSALLFPVMASLVLLAFFYFFQIVSALMLLMTVVSAFSALGFAFLPLYSMLFPTLETVSCSYDLLLPPHPPIEFSNIYTPTFLESHVVGKLRRWRL